MKWRLLPAVLSFCMPLLILGPAQGQNAEKVAFSTFTPTGHTNLLLGSAPRADFHADAVLTLPTSVSKRLPVIIILPGAGGHVDDHLAFWRSRLLSSGFGVVAVDPLRVRNLGPAQSERLSPAADLADAFNVLKAVAAHPLVDRDRVAILGFSRGGLSAWDAQAEAFTTAVLGPSAGVRFAAHAALYPPCHYAHVERLSTPVPTLLVLAGADARTPPEHCLALVKVASARGYSTEVTVVDGAQHAFDYFVPVFQDSNAFSSKGCRPLAVDTAAPYPRPFHLDDGSPLVATDGAAPVGRILEWARQCRRPTTAPTGNQNADERERAASAVVAFFVATLKP